MEMSKKRRATIIVTVILLSAVLVIIDWLIRDYFESSFLIIMSVSSLSLILYLINLPFRERVISILNIVGEDKSSINERPIWYFLLVPILLFVFSFYILLGNSQINTPPVLQFNIIIVSATLGGLILAAATIVKIKSRELLSIAQKLIISTILFIFATALLFLVELLGEIESPKWFICMFHEIFFWITVICFFPGIILFSIGIIDLIVKLGDIRRSISEGKSKEKD